MNRRYYTGGDLSRAVSIEDLREMTHRRLPRFSLEYVEGGSEDELTLKRNRDVFSRITWVPRTLAASGMTELGVEIMGQPCHMPLVIAPTGFNGLLWPQGDLALARAAAAAGIPFTLSTASNYDYRQLVRDVDGQMWYQLYPFKDQKMVDAIIDRLEQAGCRVLVVTSDFPAIGAREWDQRNYRSPMKLSTGSILDVLAHPRWLWQVMVPHGAPRFANVVDFLPHGSKSALLGAKYLSNQLNTMLAWPDMERLRTRWKGKLVIKGVLAIEDARRAAAIGADAIVLSNHGGRQLDSTIAGIEALPAVAAELREKITILVDGGFRRGADVLKAMALGAHGVMLGRATLYGLAAGGEPGVTRALAMLRSEMERVMTLLGCRTMSELGRHLIRS